MTTTGIQRVAPQAPAPHALPEASEPAAHPFAELLKQNRDAAAASPHVDSPPETSRTVVRAPEAARDESCATAVEPPPPPAASSGEPAPAEDTSPSTASTEDAAPSDATPAPTSASKAKPRATPSTRAADGDDRTEGPRGKRDDRGPIERHAPVTGDGAAATLANGMSRATPAATTGDGSAGIGTQADADGGRRIEGDLRGGSHLARAAHAMDAKGLEGRALADARIDGIASSTTPHGLAGESRAAPADAASAAGPAAFAIPSAPTTGAPPPVVDASVATPVSAPDFAQAFAVQVSVLAADGVQRAELHLNPAELGPVSVHIALDGQQARVDFGADAAATRHAIEAGLPELASALRDAGFTLTGGGVASHAGGQGRDDGARDGTPARAHGSPSHAIDATAPVRRSVVRAGGIDLYA